MAKRILTRERKASKPILQLVPKGVSDDTKEALKFLTEDADRGDLIGIAFAAMYRNREYFVSAAGEAYRNPTFALGMVEMLSAGLRGQADE